MRMIISFAALFMSVALLQLSSGGVGPLDALTGLELGFSQSAVGFLGSAHFLGFFIGLQVAAALLGKGPAALDSLAGFYRIEPTL